MEALLEEIRSELQLRCKNLILDHVAEERKMGSKASLSPTIKHVHMSMESKRNSGSASKI